jgi:hypothetical protein
MESTRDYGLFQTVVGNRGINIRHVDELVQVIKRKNLLQYFPLLINEHKQIIDGQHRLAAARVLHVPVYYVEIPGLTLADVMSINTHSKSWTLLDFVNARIQQGLSQYQVLLDFSERHQLGLLTSARLINGERTAKDGGVSISNVVKEGRFKLNHLEYAEMLAEHLDEVQRFADFDVKKDRTFISSIRIAEQSPNFDWQTFISKLTLHGLRIETRAQVRYYVLEIEELYNYKSRTYVDIYASGRNNGHATVNLKDYKPTVDNITKSKEVK